jgi:purine-binding chemotaxis protein CheW
MTAGGNDLLQGYIDELLRDAPAPAPSSEVKPQAATEELRSPPTPVAPLLDDDDRREQLQQLLYSARASVTQHMTPEPDTAPAPTALKETPAPIATPDVAPLPRATPTAEVAVSETPAAEPQAVLDEALQWHKNGRPGWAQEPFEVLLFTVSGLTLAVPLIALGQIQPLTDELTPLFGQADWFMGLQPTSSGKVRTVNTAKFVMPERYDPSFVESAQYVVSINGVPWGLAVDRVEQPMRLAPDDVKWRSSRSKRPWLAGTVKEHMCALIDIPMMGKLLTDADRNSRK